MFSVTKDMMGESEHGAFYVVRKANMVAVYSNLSDCQAQVSSSVIIFNPTTISFATVKND